MRIKLMNLEKAKTLVGDVMKPERLLKKAAKAISESNGSIPVFFKDQQIGNISEKKAKIEGEELLANIIFIKEKEGFESELTAKGVWPTLEFIINSKEVVIKRAIFVTPPKSMDEPIVVVSDTEPEE